MNFVLNTWSSPEVARTWPEGSQIVWRIRNPSLHKTHHYGESNWHRPDWIGTEFWPFREPGIEFMLLEVPIT